MAIKKYYDSDCNLGVLDGKTVAVIGFGSQGHAHSENLAESGVNVVVGLRKGSAHWEKASEFAATHENFKVMELEEAAKKVGGHGGMDYIMDYRLVYCLRNGLPLDMDVYDLAEWCCMAELTRISIENGNVPVAVPDFTRGYWNKIQGYRHAWTE